MAMNHAWNPGTMHRAVTGLKWSVEAPIHSRWQEPGEEFRLYELLTWTMSGLEHEIDRMTEVLYGPEPREYPATEQEIKALEMNLDRKKRMYFLCNVIRDEMAQRKIEYTVSIQISGAGIEHGGWEPSVHMRIWDFEKNPDVEQY